MKIQEQLDRSLYDTPVLRRQKFIELWRMCTEDQQYALIAIAREMARISMKEGK